VRLIAALSWYQEPSAWLTELVRSLAGCCDHLVAVDGAYELFPGSHDQPCSPVEQAAAILLAADTMGLPVTLHRPRQPFAGNEIEKRTLLLRLAQQHATIEEDWLLVVDGDMLITRADPGLRDQLATPHVDVADYRLWWRDDRHATEIAQGIDNNPGRPGETPVRCLFRVLENMRVEHAHYCHIGDRDGRSVYYREAAAADLGEQLQIEHRHAFRNRPRQIAAHAYYRARDQQHIESAPPRLPVR